MRTTWLYGIVLLFATTGSHAQNKFTRFVESKKISWAADLSDTFHFPRPNLSELLREQFFNNKIKVALVEDMQTMQPISYESLPAVLSRMRPNVEIEPAAYRDSLFSPNAFDQRLKDLVEIRDIVYIEKGLLRSYAYAVSPKYLVQTSWGLVLGMSNLFTTALTEKRTFSNSVQKKATTLGSTIQTIVLDDNGAKAIKQLYGQNLLQALWPYLTSKHYEIFRVDSNKKIDLQEVTLSLIQVPAYDGNGNIVPAPVAPALSAESFYSVDIVQDWFYNKEKNILLGKIAYLLLNIKSGGSDDPTIKPLLKIVVK